MPKFINFSSDAKVATLQGIKGALSTAVTNVQAVSMLQGQFNVRKTGPNGGVVDINGNALTVYNNGVPRELWLNGFEHLLDIDVEHIGSGTGSQQVVCSRQPICVIDFLRMDRVFEGKYGAYGIFFFPKGTSLSDRCFAYYGFKLDSDGVFEYMEIDVVESGC
ncbi:hypothetical protein [Alteromonas oceanisediminis]|uniref:hypothetical protein n=1 Tax=Alteromonas oceanisediminis TaxID=2836180 RepID=UPI0020239AC1|nr:hypothetical protein [Alteromonas oceanisediminis]